jgi:uncharacterized protein (DUF924 family)
MTPIQAEAQAICRFWFEETPAELHFASDPAFDATCAARFGALRDRVLAEQAAGWWDAGDTILAAVILLDQMSRNIHRGTPKAFEADPLARRLAGAAIDAGWDATMSPLARQFLYLPFMHAENAEDQARSLRLFEALGNEEALRYARAHADAIARFGRFPGRNAALGRPSSAAERAYLADEAIF